MASQQLLTFSKQVQNALFAYERMLDVHIQTVRYFGGPVTKGLHVHLLVSKQEFFSNFPWLCSSGAVFPNAWFLALYMLLERKAMKHYSIKVESESSPAGGQVQAAFADEVYIIAPASYLDKRKEEDDKQTFCTVERDIQQWLVNKNFEAVTMGREVHMIMLLGNLQFPPVSMHRILEMIGRIQDENPLMHCWDKVCHDMKLGMLCKRGGCLSILSKEPHLLLVILAFVENSWAGFQHWAVC